MCIDLTWSRVLAHLTNAPTGGVSARDSFNSRNSASDSTQTVGEQRHIMKNKYAKTVSIFQQALVVQW